MRINAAEREEHNFFMENDDLYWKEQYILDSFKTAISCGRLALYDVFISRESRRRRYGT
jgi:hypothetical protein